jgi:hypothetical protein
MYLKEIQAKRKLGKTKQERERAITEQEIQRVILESEGCPMILGASMPRSSTPNKPEKKTVVKRRSPRRLKP